MRTVHVRINDAKTGQPTPVRLRITGPDGTYYPPLGRLVEFSRVRVAEGNLALDGRAFAYIDGACEVLLPPGTLHVDIHKGPEFVPVQRTVELGVGQISLRFAVERRSDLRKEGWYGGDIWCGGLSPHAALLEGAAEDLAVVNLLASESHEGRLNVRTEEHRVFTTGHPNLLAFSGQTPALERPGHMVVVNTWNQLDRLGSVGLLNCHRIVFPLTARCDWTIADWCDQCHRKGGLAVWPVEHIVRTPNRVHGEGLADLILAKIDAILLDPTHPRIWYDLLNLGFRVPLAAGSRKIDHLVPLGRWRTYARIDGDFSYKAWIEAVRAGRSFVTSGPILRVAVDGEGPGGVVRSAGNVHVRVDAEGHVPFDRLDIVAEGKVAKRLDLDEPAMAATLEGDLEVPASCWIAAVCKKRREAPRRAKALAHTAPIHIEVADKPRRVDDQMLAPWLHYLNAMSACITTSFDEPNHRERFETIFHAARAKLEGIRVGVPPSGGT